MPYLSKLLGFSVYGAEQWHLREEDEKIVETRKCGCGEKLRTFGGITKCVGLNEDVLRRK